MPYYAHSSPDRTWPPPEGWQLLNEHLQNVAARARAFAAEMGVATEVCLLALAEAAGWLHDLGKYRKGFQEYLNGRLFKGDPLTLHKQAGAKKANDMKLVPLAFAVFGHHGGLPDKTDLEAGLKDAAADYAPIWDEAAKDCPALGSLSRSRPTLGNPFQADLLTRMLFSCLVDADWGDTGEHKRRVLKLPEEPMPPPLDPGERYKQLAKHLAALAERPLEAHVKKARADVLAACLAKANEPSGLFSLTVPTGGGKTLASLAFALKHAIARSLRRIIYVAPYMTILEQNADVIRTALGIDRNDPFLFEHYSLAEPPGENDKEETGLSSAARRAENWDAPFIITTNVQFFESLFSNQPGRCRKLHNIARSVIILDECQTLPPGLAAPTCGMLKQLTADLGCTIVLCTGTQPAFDHDSLKDDERLAATEIIPATMRQRDEHDLFVRLKRVTVTWPKEGEVLDWPDVAARMVKEKAALCVVNTKKAARAVFAELKKTADVGVFHLSTGMCPQHRREKLAEIKSQLALGAPCYVVSTQLIEAGVDVDFPFLMREIGPFESINQAAGRCNREGKLANAGGRVLVFRSVNGGLPKSTWYKQGRDIVEQILSARGDGPQIDDAEAIKDYFSRLYWGGDLDAARIREKRSKFQFKTIASGEENGKHAYKLIDNPGQPVVVATWKSHGEEIASLLDELEARPRRAVFRQLARFQVNLFPSERLRSAHLLHEGAAALLVWDGQYSELEGIIHEMLDDVLVV